MAQHHAGSRSDMQHGYMRITIACPHCQAKAAAVHIHRTMELA